MRSLQHTQKPVIIFICMVLLVFLIAAVSPLEAFTSQANHRLTAAAPKVDIQTGTYSLPSADLEWNFDDAFPGEVIHVQSASPVSFTGLSVGWRVASGGDSIDQFEIHIRTRQAGGRFCRWHIFTGVEYPEATPSGFYWSELFLTPDENAHDEFEVKLVAPEGASVASMKVSVADASVPDGEAFQVQGGVDPLQAAAPGDAPDIITRNQWWGSLPAGEINAPRWKPVKITVTHGILHHTATINDPENPSQQIRNIWHYHANTLGWGDIGYNFLIDQHGNIYQGRYNPWLYTTDIRAGHAFEANGASFGVGLLGQFHPTAASPAPGRPTAEAIAAFEELCAWRFTQLNLNPLENASIVTGAKGREVTKVVPRISGHRDLDATACPGDRLYAYLPQIREDVAALIPYGVLDDTVPVNISDVILILRDIAGLPPLADNPKGDMDVRDAILMLRHMLGLS